MVEIKGLGPSAGTPSPARRIAVLGLAGMLEAFASAAAFEQAHASLESSIESFAVAGE